MEKQLSSHQRREMDAVATRLPTKSAKIRALDEAGFARADIARFLDIRYQHVRNVLIRAEEKKLASANDDGRAVSAGTDWAQIGPDGRILIPAAVRKSLGLEAGDPVFMEVQDQVLRIVGRDQAIQQVQGLVAKYIPSDVSLVDELIAERRQEAVKEDADTRDA